MKGCNPRYARRRVHASLACVLHVRKIAALSALSTPKNGASAPMNRASVRRKYYRPHPPAPPLEGRGESQGSPPTYFGAV